MTGRTLVAGSYPPVPGPAAAASLRSVRCELANGAEVQVMSPRPSAAHHVGTLHGLRASLALFSRGRAMRADTVILCVEPGVPFEVGSSRWRIRVEAAALVSAMRRFRRVVILAPVGLGASADAARALWARADEVVVSDDEMRTRTVAIDGVRPASVVVVADEPRTGEIRVPAPTIHDAAGGAVTAQGPRLTMAESLPLLPERSAHALERVGAQWAHVVLGDRAGIIGRPLRAMVAPLRRAVMKMAERSPPVM